MTEPVTIIGARTFVSGTIEGDEEIAVEGSVQGSIRLSAALVVEESGVVRADVEVQSLVVRGILVGNAIAEESVHVAETGRMVGDIKAPRVTLAEGASFCGTVDMGEFDVGIDFEQKPRLEKSRPLRSRVPQPSAPSLPPAMLASAPPPRIDEVAVKKRSLPPLPKVRALGRAKAIKKNA